MRVHVVAPDGFEDPVRPSGGNVYDRRVCTGLAEAGWDVLITTVAGAWPACDRAAKDTLARTMAAIPDGEAVLLDGLIASPSASILLPHLRRLHAVVLLHMPLATAAHARTNPAASESERAVLHAASAVVVPSEWTRQQLLNRGAVPAERICVVRPGVDDAHATRRRRTARAGGGRLLCLATLTFHKGQDLLVEALAPLADADWTCVLAGRLDDDPGFVDQLRTLIARRGLNDRIHLAGVLIGRALHRAYTAADLLVVPSRSETYGMVVTEALARGLPVLATAVGGLPEALGFTADGSRPGQLVPPDNPRALTAALTQWLQSETHRRRLRTAALERRTTLSGWDKTVRDLAAALQASGTRVTQRPTADGRREMPAAVQSSA